MKSIPNKGFKAFLAAVLGLSLCLHPFSIQAHPSALIAAIRYSRENVQPTENVQPRINPTPVNSLTTYFGYISSAFCIGRFLSTTSQGIKKIWNNPKKLVSRSALRITGLSCTYCAMSLGSCALTSKLETNYNTSHNTWNSIGIKLLTGGLYSLGSTIVNKLCLPKITESLYDSKKNRKPDNQLSSKTQNLLLEKSWYSGLSSMTNLSYGFYTL